MSFLHDMLWAISLLKNVSRLERLFVTGKSYMRRLGARDKLLNIKAGRTFSNVFSSMQRSKKTWIIFARLNLTRKSFLCFRNLLLAEECFLYNTGTPASRYKSWSRLRSSFWFYTRHRIRLPLAVLLPSMNFISNGWQLLLWLYFESFNTIW